MSYMEAMLDFSESLTPGVIEQFNKYFDHGLLYSIVWETRTRLCVSLRRHAPFWDAVHEGAVEWELEGRAFAAKVYTPPSSAPGYAFDFLEDQI